MLWQRYLLRFWTTKQIWNIKHTLSRESMKQMYSGAVMELPAASAGYRKQPAIR